MSALAEIRKRAIIDIDQLDPILAEKLGPFHDMTSNQALLAGVATTEPEPKIIQEVVDRVKASGKKGEEATDLGLDLLAVLLAKSVLPHLTGRVHAQLSPRYFTSTSQSLSHAHRLIALFEKEGIPRSRVCLKIPTNGPGMVAASQLESEGVRTLATTLFSVDQALAAVQAGCLYIAPYFNELSVHFDPTTWKEYDDTAEEHPMSKVIKEIVKVYKGKEKKPLIMPASIVTSTEALAISTLGVDHITIAGKVLQALADDKDVPVFRGKEMDVEAPESGIRTGGRGADPTDYLANGGKALDERIAGDKSVSRRLEYALKAFGDCERKVIQVLEARL